MSVLGVVLFSIRTTIYFQLVKLFVILQVLRVMPDIILSDSSVAFSHNTGDVLSERADKVSD